MKKSILSDFGSLLLLATALGQQASAASSREQTLKYWKEETDATSLLGTRMPIICEQSESQRCLHVPVTKSIYQEKTIEEVAGNNYRRKMQGSLSHNSTLYPSPADGSLIAYSPLAIQFAANGISEDTAKFTFTPLGGNQGDAVTVDETVVNSAASVKLGGFDVGSWKWTVEGTNQTYTFEVVEAPQLRSATITNTQVDEAPWQLGGQVAGTSGRLYYASNGVNYACSATAIKDNKSGRSLILTAAHCVWDDVNKKFGVNVLFIPDRDQINETLAGSIGRKCDADVCGCWTASAGVVLERWKTVTWPNRLAYDYGIWIIDDFAAHSGKNCTTTGALDDAVDAFQFDVGVNLADKFTYAFGYSYKYRPDLRVSYMLLKMIWTAKSIDFRRKRSNIHIFPFSDSSIVLK